MSFATSCQRIKNIFIYNQWPQVTDFSFFLTELNLNMREMSFFLLIWHTRRSYFSLGNWLWMSVGNMSGGYIQQGWFIAGSECECGCGCGDHVPFGEARGELGEEGGSRLVRGAAVAVRAARRAARPRLTCNRPPLLLANRFPHTGLRASGRLRGLLTHIFF